MEISTRPLGQEIAEIIYPNFVTGTLIVYHWIPLEDVVLYMMLYMSTNLYVCLKLILIPRSRGWLKLVRKDHPDNVKRGGVCIYYDESLPVRVLNLPYLQEALLLELNDEIIIISSLYCFPSQNSEEFKSFLSDINARKPSVSVILGNFNTRLTSWWSNDIDSLEGTKIFSLSTSNGLSLHIFKETSLLVLI